MGLDKFTDMITGIGDGFNKFGLTMAEGADWAAEYLQQQRLLANYSIYTQRGLNEAIRSNIDRLTAFSKILNVSRSEIQAAQTEAASDLRVRARFLVEGEAMHKDAEKNFMRMIGNFAGLKMEGLANVLTEFMGFAGGEWQKSDMFGELHGTAASGVVQVLGELTDAISYGPLSDKDADMYMRRLGDELLDPAALATWKEIQENTGLNPAQEAIFNAALAYAEAREKGDIGGDGSVSPAVQAAAALNQNLNRLKNSVPMMLASAVEKLAKFLGLEEGVEGGMTAGMNLIAEKAGMIADWLLRVVEGKIDWKAQFKEWAVILWDAAESVFDGVEAAIMEGAQLVADAIDRINPFNLSPTKVTQSDIDESLRRRSGTRDSYAKMADGSLGQNAMQLEEAMKFLAGAENALAMAQRNAMNFPDNEGIQSMVSIREQELEQRREMIRELKLQRQELYKQTGLQEENTG
jgi:hypothetical protein